MRRPSAGAQRAAERRARENAAERLHEVIPDLKELKIHVEEGPQGAKEPEVAHVRHIVVQRAPAIFEMGCSDRKCDGNHDLTSRFMEALKGHEEEFTGADMCDGTNADGSCLLELRFTAKAKF